MIERLDNSWIVHLSFFSFLGARLFSNYGAKTSLENRVKQLRDDVNDQLEYVRTSQLIEGETKLTEDTSSERLGK